MNTACSKILGMTPDGEVYDTEAMKHGSFERAISMFRTSYSFVAVSRKDLPDEVRKGMNAS